MIHTSSRDPNKNSLLRRHPPRAERRITWRGQGRNQPLPRHVIQFVAPLDAAALDRRHRHAVAVDDLVVEQRGHTRAGARYSRQVERVTGRQNGEPVVLVGASNVSKTLYRFGDGVLLANEIGDEPSPSNLAASLGASIDP